MLWRRLYEGCERGSILEMHVHTDAPIAQSSSRKHARGSVFQKSTIATLRGLPTHKAISLVWAIVASPSLAWRKSRPEMSTTAQANSYCIARKLLFIAHPATRIVIPWRCCEFFLSRHTLCMCVWPSRAFPGQLHFNEHIKRPEVTGAQLDMPGSPY